MFDLIIENATLIDGSGADAIRTNVAVEGDQFAGLDCDISAAAHRRINADGLVLAPGFIDSHSHDDLLLLQPPRREHPKLSQGVTSVVTGNCGLSLAPSNDAKRPPPFDIFGELSIQQNFSCFSQYLDALQHTNLHVNAACLIGHTSVRVKHVQDLTKTANTSEIEAMRIDIEKGLAAGALGMSTGVFYEPARSAGKAEIVAVADRLNSFGGLLSSHVRDESDGITRAIEEAIDIARAVNVPLILSHHKLVGTQNFGKSVQTLALIEDAAKTHAICLDCYPYAASSTTLLPSRVEQCSEVLISWSKAFPEAAGKKLSLLAKERGQSWRETAEQLVPAGAIYFAMDEADVERILKHPLTMIGSDGLPHDASPHPRLWGSFPRVLGLYARDRRTFSIETAIHKMTGLTAARYGLSGRGLIKRGFFADFVLFDPAQISDKATYDAPTIASRGISKVFVNGQECWADGESINSPNGRLIKRTRRVCESAFSYPVTRV
jgi:N-acyl-D-amino-acid deacylase